VCAMDLARLEIHLAAYPFAKRGDATRLRLLDWKRGTGFMSNSDR
jgi:hypothetical protein